MFDEEEAECPLCMEPLDETDKGFFPCACGYQICGFCWHKLRNEGNGLCPACRTPFEDRPAEFAHVDADSARAKEKQRKAHERKPRDNDHRKNLANVRVVQPNLVYVIGLSPRLADESVIRKNDYFGQYGKIMKVVVNKGSLYNGSHGPSASAYITYQRKEDAQDVIRAVDGLMVDNRVVRASFGTTKYCSYFLKHVSCPNPDCMYLHEVGETVDSFTKEEMKGFPQRSDYDHSRSPSPTRVATPVQNGAVVKKVVSTKPRNPNASALPANASWAKKTAAGAHISHPGSMPAAALSLMKEIAHPSDDYVTPPHGNSVRKASTQWPGASKDATWNQGDTGSAASTPVTTQQPTSVHMNKKSPRIPKNAKQVSAISPPASGVQAPSTLPQSVEDPIPDNWDERDGDNPHSTNGPATVSTAANASGPGTKAAEVKATNKTTSSTGRKAAATSKARPASPVSVPTSPAVALAEVPNVSSTTSVSTTQSIETRTATKPDRDEPATSEKLKSPAAGKKKAETTTTPVKTEKNTNVSNSQPASAVETGESDVQRKPPLVGSTSETAPPGLFSAEHAELKHTYSALPGISDNNSSMFSHSGVGPIIGHGPPGLVRMPGAPDADSEASDAGTSSHRPGDIGSAPGSLSSSSIGGGGSRFAFGNRDEDEGGEFASSFFSSMSLSDPKKGTSAFGLPPRGLGAPPGLGDMRDETAPTSFGSLTDFGLDHEVARPKNQSSLTGPVASASDLAESKFSAANWDDDKRMTPSGLGADALRFPSGLGERSSGGSGVSAPPGLALGGVSEMSGLGATTPENGSQAHGTGNARQWQDNLRSLFPGVNISFSVGNPEQSAQQTQRGGLSSDPIDQPQPLEIGTPHLRGQSMWDNGFDGPGQSSLPNTQHSLNSSTWGMSDSPYSSLLHNNRGELHQSFLSTQDSHFDIRGSSGTTSSLPPPPSSSSRGFDQPPTSGLPRQGHAQHIQQRQPQTSYGNRPTQPGSISQHSQSQQQAPPPPPPGLQHAIPSRQIQNNDEQISRMYDHNYSPGGINSNTHRSNNNIGFNNSGSFPPPPPGVSMMQDSQGLNMHPSFGRQENREMFHRPGAGLHLQQQQQSQQQHHQQQHQQQQLSSKIGDYGINGAKSGDGWPSDNISNSGGIWNESNEPPQHHNRRQQPQHRPPPGFSQPPPPPQLSGRQQRGNLFDNPGNGPLGLNMPPGPPGLHQQQQPHHHQQQHQHPQQHLYDSRAKPMGGVWGADPSGINQQYGGDVNDSRFVPQRQSQQAFGMPWGGSYFPSDQSNKQTGIGGNGGWPASEDHRNDFDIRGAVRDGSSPVLPPPGFENVSPGYMSGIDKLIDE